LANPKLLDVAGLRRDFKGPHELIQASDGSILFVRRWVAAGSPPASVLIFHGITGHSGPYGPMIAERLASGGFEVWGLDLRGHGLSDGKRGDYPSEERFLLDLHETILSVRAKSKKLVLLGHSLGVLAAISAFKGDTDAVDGIVLVSAARKMRARVYPKPSAAARLKVLVGMVALKGSPLIEYRREGQLGLDDPLFNFRYSVRFYTVLYGAGARRVMAMTRTGVFDSPNMEFAGKVGVPVMVAVGDRDELFPSDAAKEFCDSIDSDDKEFHVIPGAAHAVFPKDSWDPLVLWLRQRY
jgi:alpha-beta hydrolase superfamily lysophospholipase